MEDETTDTAPRERKIRRGIVLLSSFQVGLGAVIIGMSFTAFASTSSSKIRSSSPYWAGFMALFTGSVGFLTWKQLSIVSIGIYTFLSTACVVICLVATVLTGDAATFLKAITYCQEVKFEHACQCCIGNDTCDPRYKFPSVRNCDTLNGFLIDIMYCLCISNVLCCLMCLVVTLVGCTLGAQYSRYSQNCAFRLAQSPHSNYDHRYDWSPFPIDALDNFPPCAPPVYCPASRGASSNNRNGLPKLFDSVDFPPPYSSREPSIADRRDLLNADFSIGNRGISWERLGPTAFRFSYQTQTATVSDESVDYLERTIFRGRASTSGSSEAEESSQFGRNTDMQGANVVSQSVRNTCVSETISSISTESELETTGLESARVFSLPMPGVTTDAVVSHCYEQMKRHSWAQLVESMHSESAFCLHDESSRAHNTPLIDRWIRNVSGVIGTVTIDSYNAALWTKPRANSSPACPPSHTTKLAIDAPICDEERPPIQAEISLFSRIDQANSTTVECEAHDDVELPRGFGHASTNNVRVKPRTFTNSPNCNSLQINSSTVTEDVSQVAPVGNNESNSAFSRETAL